MFTPSWLTMGLITLGLTHLLIILVTVYFHRALAHRAVNLHPVILRVFRFLSWFMMGMDPQEFAAVHRKHHAMCDTDQDPHSPVRFGWIKVLVKGLPMYQKEANNPETIEKYGKGMPVDPWEGFYRRFSFVGILLQGVLWTALFGYKGTLMWGTILLWIPFWAAGVVNGMGHHFGYRRFPTDDHSTNLLPWGFWIGGEELHNNHHARPSSPKFSAAWYEFDLGWGYIRTLMFFGLASLRAPLPVNVPKLPAGSLKNPEMILLSDRYHWMRTLYKAFDAEAQGKLEEFGFSRWKRFARKINPRNKTPNKIKEAMKDPFLSHLHMLEGTLRHIWTARLRPQDLSKSLSEWMKEARKVGPHLAAWCDHWSENLSHVLPNLNAELPGAATPASPSN